MRAEIFVLIFIVALLSLVCLTAFFSAQQQANDQKVLVDISQISTALKIYHDENGFYPSGETKSAGIESYLSFWPLPTNDCGNMKEYDYSQKNFGEDYNLTFCLKKSTERLTSGIHTLSAGGVN